ncbi:hypothetical protein CBL_05099 [Carabus blaptoides fortunei]
MTPPKKYRVLNDKRYVLVAVDAFVQQIAFDKCEAKLLRLTVGVKRLEVTLCKLRGYEAKGAVSDKEPAENLVIKDERYTNVSDMSNNTTIASSAETLSGRGAIDCLPASQTGNQTAVILDTFQTKLDKKHLNTRINGSQSGGQQMHTSNTTQDGEQEDSHSAGY